MKAKLLLMLFLVSLSLGVFALESGEKKKIPQLHASTEQRGNMKRIPARPFAQVEDINDCLYITFQRSFEDVDITIRDKEGNEVVNDQQTAIYEGRVIAIPQSDGYPYSIVITSPTVDIHGEIILE